MAGTLTVLWPIHAAIILTAAALLCALSIVTLRPLLARYAIAHPNARSSHRTPTPQGGGIAVVAATIVVSCVDALLTTADLANAMPMTVLAAVILIAVVGFMADVRPIGIAPRLLLQAFAAAVVIFSLPTNLRIFPALPASAERIPLVLGLLWFINLVNFMDGLDCMTAAEVVPVTTALAAIGFLGLLPVQDVVVSLALCGAMIGFAYFNRPVAKLFLGDVGSLPIGLLLGWLLVLVAGSGNLTAALLLPLYYLADATITVLRRLVHGERVWQSHRTHFYQRATDRGFTVTEVVARVFAVNLVLAALALASVIARSTAVDIAALACGIVLVGWLLYAFTHPRRA